MVSLASIGNTLRFIADHPLNRGHRVQAFLRYGRWQIGSRLVPGPVLFEWVGGTRVIVRPGEKGMTQNIYCGLHEFQDMGYLLHIITPQDLFVDVGANVGSYTLLACGALGARGFCFEPIPSTFARLSQNLLINSLLKRVTAVNIGIGASDGDLTFTVGKGTMNHVISGHQEGTDTITIPTRTLDSALGDESPSFIKIDVEGFETPALSGALKTLNNPALHSVLIELNGAGARYGYEEKEIVRTLFGYGFTPCDYDPLTRTLRALDGKNSTRDNTLFVRGVQEIQSRLGRAPQIKIGASFF